MCSMPLEMGLSDEGFVCSPFTYNIADDGTTAPRVHFSGLADDGEKTVVWSQRTCDAVHFAAFRELLEARGEQVLATGFGVLRSNSEMLCIDYVCSNAYENNIYVGDASPDRQRPSKEVLEYAAECRGVCRGRYNFKCHAFVLKYQKDGTVWCCRVRE
jgi:hypothetical protein